MSRMVTIAPARKSPLERSAATAGLLLDFLAAHPIEDGDQS